MMLSTNNYHLIRIFQENTRISMALNHHNPRYDGMCELLENKKE